MGSSLPHLLPPLVSVEVALRTDDSLLVLTRSQNVLVVLNVRLRLLGNKKVSFGGFMRSPTPKKGFWE